MLMEMKREDQGDTGVAGLENWVDAGATRRHRECSVWLVGAQPVRVPCGFTCLGAGVGEGLSHFHNSYEFIFS